MRKLLAVLLLLASPTLAQDLSPRTKAELRRLFTVGLATDDSVMLGNGSTWAIKAVPNCVAGALQYTAATHTISCGAVGGLLGGSGTGQNLAKWTGAGASITLGDSGITDTSSGVVPAAFTSTTLTIGNFTSATPGVSKYAGVNSTGNNIPGGSVEVDGGTGTGGAYGGAINFKVSPWGPAGSSTNSLQTAATISDHNYSFGNWTMTVTGWGTVLDSWLAGVNAYGSNQDGGRVAVRGGKGTGTGDSIVWVGIYPATTTGSSANTIEAIGASWYSTHFTLGGYRTNNGAAVPTTSTIGGVDSQGSDLVGGPLVIQSGAGTGLAAGSTITFKTPAVGSTGYTAETQTTRLTMDTVGAVMPTGQWLRQASSRASISSDYTNATDAMTNTDLLGTLKAGRRYEFRASIFLADSQAAEGVDIDFDGGNATATTFRAHCLLHDTALLLSAQTSALATDIGVATVTGDSLMECTGAIVVNAAGTLIVRARQDTHTSGTLTIYIGSHIEFEDVTGS